MDPVTVGRQTYESVEASGRSCLATGLSLPVATIPGSTYWGRPIALANDGTDLLVATAGLPRLLGLAVYDRAAMTLRQQVALGSNVVGPPWAVAVSPYSDELVFTNWCGQQTSTRPMRRLVRGNDGMWTETTSFAGIYAQLALAGAPTKGGPKWLVTSANWYPDPVLLPRGVYTRPGTTYLPLAWRANTATVGYWPTF